MIEHPLVALLRRDGVEIPDNDRVEKRVLCWVHDDHEPSMDVNSGSGLFHCKSCGASGNIWTYLERDRGFTRRQAWETLRNLGMADPAIDAEAARGDELRERRRQVEKGRPRSTDSPWFEDHIVLRHEYRLGARLLVLVARYDDEVRVDGRKLPKVLPYTPRSGGGWWACHPDHSGIPDEDRHDGKMPLYGVENLERYDGQVMVVEGEKCVDAVNAYRRIPAVCAYRGSTARLETTDWSPLRGRKVALIADADTPGRGYMRNVAKLLHADGCGVGLALPPGENGYDVAVARSSEPGGYRGIHQWVRTHLKPYEPPRADEMPLNAEAALDLGDNDHFQVLGLCGDLIAIQVKATHQIHYLPQSKLMDPGYHLMLAGLDFWRELAGEGRERKVPFREKVADELLNAGRRKGEIAADDTYGRGALRVSGEVAYHVGDALLVAGEGGRLSRRVSLSDASGRMGVLLMPRPKLGLRDDRRAREYGEELADALMGYRWAEPDHGRIYLGWMVASLIGGALPHRPVVWLVAPATAGKSYLLSETLDRLHGGVRFGLSDASGAGVAQLLQSDSLPVTLDEFEPPKKRNRDAAYLDMLKLMRQATGGTGQRVRGTPGGRHILARPRFSLLMASIDQPHMQAADESRIVTIALSRRGVEDWPELDRRITAATEPDRMAALRTEIVREAPRIAAHAADVTRRIQREIPGVDTRGAQIMGALSAGCGWLAGDPPREWPMLAKPDRAAADEEDSPLEPLAAMMSLAADGPGGLSLAEVLRAGWVDENGAVIASRRTTTVAGDESARKTASRMGWRFHEGRLAMALGHGPVAGQLARTEYSGVDIDNLVLKIAGARRHADGVRPRLLFGQVLRKAVLFDGATLKQLGILDDG